VNSIFVYGLLKPGFRLHHIAEPYVLRWAPARVRGRLYDAGSSEASPSDRLPAARFDEDGEIEGFVFWLDEARLDEALAVLDDLEDEGTEYRRIVVPASTADDTVEAFAYEYLPAVDPGRFVGPTWPE